MELLETQRAETANDGNEGYSDYTIDPTIDHAIEDYRRGGEFAPHRYRQPVRNGIHHILNGNSYVYPHGGD